MKTKTQVEHYPDPTPGQIIEREEAKVDKLHADMINVMLSVAQMCGFEVCGRIWTRHKETGKDYP